jgi:outer membrane protein
MTRRSPLSFRAPLFGVFCVTFLATTVFSGTTNGVRVLSLKDCVELALRHNLDIKIERYSPSIAGYQLSQAYGIYDPTFTFGAGGSSIKKPGAFDPDKANPDFPYELKVDAYNAGLSGLLPTGLRYDVSAHSELWDATTDFRLNPSTAANFPPTGIRSTNEYFLTAGASLRQPLLKNFWVDADRLQVQLRKKNLRMSEMALRAKVAATVMAVQMAYYELAYTRELMRVDTNAVELANQLLAETKTMVKVGRLPLLGEQEAEFHLESIRTGLFLARQEADDQEQVLRSLLMDDLNSWAGTRIEPADALSVVEEPVSMVEAWQNALNKRPELLQFREELEKHDLVLKYDRNQLFPSLDLTGSYGWRAADPSFDNAASDVGDGTHPFYSYGVILTFPLSNKAAREGLKADREIKAQALLRYKKLEIQIFSELENAAQRVETSLKRVESARVARRYAEAAASSQEKQMDAQRGTIFLLREYQRKLVEVRVAEARALADYNKALAQLAFSQGTTLERAGVTLNFK